MSLPHQQVVRPWRTATLVASAIAAFELVLILILGVALLGQPLSEKMRTTAQERSLGIPAAQTKKPKLGSTTPRLSRSETSVMVLNGNGVAGAAHDAASRAEARGYSIGHVGNAPRADYTRTVVMYRPGYRAEGLRLGRDLGVRIVAPLDGLKTRELLGAHAVLVVGA